MIHEKINIAVIELENHWDSVDGFCQFLQSPNYQLTLFTNSFIQSSLQTKAYFGEIRWILIDNKETKKHFIERHLSEFISFDCIFINTIHQKFGSYCRIYSRGPILLRVHNIHKQFAPLQYLKISFSVYNIKKAMSYLIREIILSNFFYYRNKINKLVDFFLFLEPNITSHVIANKFVDINKIGYTLPLRPFIIHKTIYSKKNNHFNLTIIGALDPKRRDYLIVIESLKLLLLKLNSTPHISLRLNLLGNSNSQYGKMIISKASELIQNNFDLNYYNEPVPTFEFENVLSKTDILICPIILETISEIYQETYGISKFSGCLGDLISHPMPSLFPEDFEVDSNLKELLINYSSYHDIADKLFELLNTPDKIVYIRKQLNEYFDEKYNKNTTFINFELFLLKAIANKKANKNK